MYIDSVWQHTRNYPPVYALPSSLGLWSLPYVYGGIDNESFSCICTSYLYRISLRMSSCTVPNISIIILLYHIYIILSYYYITIPYKYYYYHIYIEYLLEWVLHRRSALAAWMRAGARTRSARRPARDKWGRHWSYSSNDSTASSLM